MPFDPTGQDEFRQNVFRWGWAPRFSQAMENLFKTKLFKKPLHAGIEIPFPATPQNTLRVPRQVGAFVGGAGGGGDVGSDSSDSDSSGSSDEGSGSDSSDSSDGSWSSGGSGSSSSSSDSSSSSSSSSDSGISDSGDGGDGSDSSDSGGSAAPACITMCPADFDEFTGIIWSPDPPEDCLGVCPEIDHFGNALCTIAKVGECIDDLCFTDENGEIPCCVEVPPAGCYNACACCYYTGKVELAIAGCCSCP